MAETKGNIPHSDFVAKVVKDVNNPPDTILLTGYLGKSSEEGHTRLYFDPELKNYVEIPNDAVLHSQEIPEEQSSLGGAHVWIKSDAEVIHGKVGPSRTKAKFFEGPIAAAAAAAAGGAAAAGPNITNPLNCPSLAPLCPHTLLPACPPSPIHHCPPSPPPLLCPHTVLPPCPTPLCTHVFTQCPTPLHGCPPPPTPHCTIVFTQCGTPLHGCPPPPPTPLCHTPLHGCPPPPITAAVCTHLNTPCCPTHPPECVIRTPIAVCLDTAVQCQFATAAGPQCPVASGGGPGCPVGFPVGGGDPAGAAHVAAFGGQAAQAISQFCPSHPIICQPSPICPPSAHHICPTNPVFCHPSRFCPSPLHVCPTSPVICHPSPFCPSPFCPSPACPSIHIGCPQSPFCPVTGGCPFGPGGGGPQF